jgi:hypothetical protein
MTWYTLLSQGLGQVRALRGPRLEEAVAGWFKRNKEMDGSLCSQPFKAVVSEYY